MNLPSRPIDKKISIHALLAESDLGNVVVVLRTWNFYPRSPCGERHHMPAVHVQLSIFLSTLSLRRATGVSMLCQKLIPSFLSTLSLRRATSHSLNLPSKPIDFYPRSPCGERLIDIINNIVNGVFLSTLSLRRATFFWFSLGARVSYFYPRSPCGERPRPKLPKQIRERISIHALLAESD